VPRGSADFSLGPLGPAIVAPMGVAVRTYVFCGHRIRFGFRQDVLYQVLASSVRSTLPSLPSSCFLLIGRGPATFVRSAGCCTYRTGRCCPSRGDAQPQQRRRRQRGQPLSIACAVVSLTGGNVDVAPHCVALDNYTSEHLKSSFLTITILCFLSW
jgi:hypothetical protein